jgi:hypothetical protein
VIYFRKEIASLLLTLLGTDDDTLIGVLEPLHGLLTLNVVVDADAADGTAAVGNALTLAAKDDVHIHTIDTNGGVVLDTQVDVLLDTETKVAHVGEVALLKLVLLNLQSLLEDLSSLGTTDGGVNGDLLITADTEGTNGVAGWDTKRQVSMENYAGRKCTDK